jgi:hypothetical protein
MSRQCSNIRNKEQKIIALVPRKCHQAVSAAENATVRSDRNFRFSNLTWARFPLGPAGAKAGPRRGQGGGRRGGYEILIFRILRANNPSGTAMIAKTLFLAKSFSAIRMRIFRDHEILADRYPGGYPCEGAARLFPHPASRIPRPTSPDALRS